MEKKTDKTVKKIIKKPSVKPKNSKTAEFKRKYFEYYDDIKTSHKEDW